MEDLHEASSRGWDGARASCGCRLPCCLGGSLGLQTVARDLGGAEIQSEIQNTNTTTEETVIIDIQI